MGLLPQLVRLGLPAGGVLLALVAEVIHRLRGLQVRGVRAGLLDHLAQKVGILQHGAGAQVVVVEGLAVVVGHENGRLKALQQRLFPDVGVGIVINTQGSMSPLALMWK